jgi:cytochrome c peroxidase
MRGDRSLPSLARLGKLRLTLSLAALAGIAIAAYVALAHISDQPKVREKAALTLLGRQIFFDSQFSVDGKTSCSSCHRPNSAFADGRPLAVGVNGYTGTRNTPSLLASAESKRSSFFWDGRRSDLSVAVLDPFTNPVEMGLSSRDQIAWKINASPMYKATLREAFGTDVQAVGALQISQALTAYLMSIGTKPTAYDRYASSHDSKALSPQAIMGMSIFVGKGQCATCHALESGAFTDHAFHRTGVGLESIAQDLPDLTASMLHRPLRDEGLGPWVATHPREAQLGRFNVTHKVTDIEVFATPSLRHVSLTAPYMHDGSVPTLEGAIDREIYYRSLDTGYPIGLTVQERKDLRAFLETL